MFFTHSSTYCLHLVRRIDYLKDVNVDVKDAEAEDSCIVGMSYSATHDEQYIADLHNDDLHNV